MAQLPIRVGFIGLNPDRGWVATAHIPALRSLAGDFTIAGVANRSYDSAVRAAEAFGVGRAYSSPAKLISSSEIDLVAVTVKVPDHFELVSAVLGAGKHVYCEWPLGNGLDEARSLARLARERGVVAAIGTQGVTARGVNHAKSLIESGFVGRVLSTSLIGSGGGWTNETSASSYYLHESANGATMQSIVLGHALATIEHVLGGFGPLEASFARNFDVVRISETGELRPKDVPDQVMVHGRMASGAAVSVHFRGGSSRATNLLWEINGTDGDIQITGDMGYPQIVRLGLAGARGSDQELAPLHFEDGDDALAPAARNVAGIYERVAADIRTGSRIAPTFDDGVRLHELLARIETSAAAEEHGAAPTI